MKLEGCPIMEVLDNCKKCPFAFTGMLECLDFNERYKKPEDLIMKLPIKKKYFDQIKSGEKDMEYRDAHITFICEETGEILVCDVLSVDIWDCVQPIFPHVLEDKNTIALQIKLRE